MTIRSTDEQAWREHQAYCAARRGGVFDPITCTPRTPEVEMRRIIDARDPDQRSAVYSAAILHAARSVSPTVVRRAGASSRPHPGTNKEDGA